jgi:hypothetical protein
LNEHLHNLVLDIGGFTNWKTFVAFSFSMMKGYNLNCFKAIFLSHFSNQLACKSCELSTFDLEVKQQVGRKFQIS